MVRGIHHAALGGVKLNGFQIFAYQLVFDPLEVAPIVPGGSVHAADGKVDEGPEGTGRVVPQNHLVAVILVQPARDTVRINDSA